MKTPRDLLLSRHLDTGPQLDAARQRTLAAFAAQPNAEASSRPTSPGFLHALAALAHFLRWHLAAMSAVWIVAAWLGTLDHDAPTPRRMSRSPSAPDELMAALRENRRQIAELLGSFPPESSPAKVPASLPPGRRTGSLEQASRVAATA
jgi:hypothetical protein